MLDPDDLDSQVCWSRSKVDSKFEAMLERLRRVRERGMRQAMVFSFFTGTLRTWSGACASTSRSGSMTGRDAHGRAPDDHGGLPRRKVRASCC